MVFRSFKAIYKMVREPCYAKSIRKGRVSRRCLRISQSLDTNHCIGNHSTYSTPNSEYNRSRVLPSLQSINLSPERHHCKRLLRRISEDLETTADEMTFVEHSDFQQGSASNEPQQRPQYYGNGLGNASFVEDGDDYEFLLDEGLAREGLYRGMSL